jgi:hypothetical protein
MGLYTPRSGKSDLPNWTAPLNSCYPYPHDLVLKDRRSVSAKLAKGEAVSHTGHHQRYASKEEH